jgi:CRP-like cAMP-binding protein
MQFEKEFQQLKVFQGLSEYQIKELNPAFDLNQYSEQQTIFYQGDPAQHFFLLLQGKVSIRYKPYDGQALTITNIAPGGVFGWSAALGRDMYSSSAIASLESTALSISKPNLYKICALENETGIIFLGNLTSVIAERLHQNYSHILNLLTRASHAALVEETKK